MNNIFKHSNIIYCSNSQHRIPESKLLSSRSVKLILNDIVGRSVRLNTFRLTFIRVRLPIKHCECPCVNCENHSFIITRIV
jgi:hypothetical protein